MIYPTEIQILKALLLYFQLVDVSEWLKRDKQGT